MSKRRGNNEGTIKKRADGRWEARMSLPDGKRKSLYGETYREVERKLRDARNDLDKGVLPADGRQTVEQYLLYWLSTVKHEIEPSSYRAYCFHVRRIIAEFGRIALAKLTPQQVQAFYAKKLGADLAPTTVATMHVVFKSALKDAVRLGVIPRSVLDVVKSPKFEPRPKQVLTKEQARQFLVAAKGDRFENLYILALTTGMRVGEILALQWDDIDFEKRLLHVKHGMQRGVQGYAMGGPKSESSRRTIALSSLALEALRAQQKRLDSEREMLGEAWDMTHDLVFPNAFGKHQTPDTLIRRAFPKMLRKAGLPDIHFHDLRHTAATLLLKEGVHLKVVSEMLGHSDVSITLRIYAHVLPNMQRDAANAVHTIFGGQDE